MSFYHPDGITAYETEDGGFELVIVRRGRIYSRVIEPNGFVTQIEAAAILRPPVSRVAVFKWVKSGKLKDDDVDGVSMIRLSRLRRFAAKYGKALALPQQK